MEKKKRIRVIMPKFEDETKPHKKEVLLGDAMEAAKRHYNADTGQCMVCEYSEAGFCKKYGDFCDVTRKNCDEESKPAQAVFAKKEARVSQEECDWDLALFASKIKLLPNACWIIINESTAKGAGRGSCEVAMLYGKKERHLQLKTDAKNKSEMIQAALLRALAEIEVKGSLVNVMVTDDAGFGAGVQDGALKDRIAALSKRDGLNIVFRVFDQKNKAVNQRMAEVIINNMGKSHIKGM